jgi:hypothetical protein
MRVFQLQQFGTLAPLSFCMMVASPSPEASRGGGVFALHPDVTESLHYISAKDGKEDICNFRRHVRVTRKRHCAFILLNVNI